MNTYVPTKLTVEKEMEVCLLILSILENDIKKVDNGELLMLTERYIDLLLSIDIPIIKSRLCVFFQSYLDYFNRKKGDNSIQYETNTKIIHSLFNYLMYYKETPGLSYQAAHSLTSLIRYKIYSNIVGDVSKQILPDLIKIIGEVQILLFFDVLNNIVLYLDVEDKVMLICKELTQRILTEIKSPLADLNEGHYNSYTNKCFNILLSIVEKYKFFLDERTDSPSLVIFEQTINPLMLYLKNPTKIFFDDDLIVLLTILIKNVEVISAYMGEIFPVLTKYLKKHLGINKHLYNLLLAYLQYSGDFFNTQNNLVILTQIIEYGLSQYDELEESGPYAALDRKSVV